jgi:hypothetical protein
VDEPSAQALAEVLGGDTWDTGGGLWLVLKKRSDGRVVAISDEAINVYENDESVQTGLPLESVLLV